MKHGISTTHRVWIELPDELTDAMGVNDDLKRSFNRELEKAIAGNGSSGSNSYSYHEEWADFQGIADARAAEVKLIALVKKYLGFIPKDQA